MFRRTISDEDKEESDFASDYAALVEVLRDFISRNKHSADWSSIFIEMQGEVSAFKKPLRTLDNQGECWKHVRKI